MRKTAAGADGAAVELCIYEERRERLRGKVAAKRWKQPAGQKISSAEINVAQEMRTLLRRI
jgi:hypothetical protein